jgi:diguanylate cyclase (GGDEF)-like protein
VIRATVTLDKQDEFASHYVACWAQDNCLIRCWHEHKTIAEAATCIQRTDGLVRAVTEGRERSLTYEEQEGLVRALLELYHAERARSRKDDKTGLLNERGFREVLSDEMARSRRYPRPLTIVYIDLDDFKAVNDEHGHPTGDLVLRIVGETMRRAVREVDCVARLHGDEFALLFPEANAVSASRIVGKLKSILEDTMKAHQWKITLSIGAVTFKTPLAAPDYMIEQADKLMYSVKRTGKNRAASLTLD